MTEVLIRTAATGLFVFAAIAGFWVLAVLSRYVGLIGFNWGNVAIAFAVLAGLPAIIAFACWWLANRFVAGRH